jgi:hypothetical protein
MNGKLHTLGLVLILSALIVSGCATPTPEPVGPSTGEGEYCVDKASGTKMSYEEAVEIAEGSECVAQGGLKETRFCNEDTGTWWIDLDIEKAGCMPACVVKVSDKTAEINWRCTGAVPPEDTVAVPDPARARDVALDYIFDRYSEVVFPPPGSDWTEENVTGEGLVGASTFRYTAADLVVTVSFPVVNPADTIYQVVVSKEGTDFRWEGEVDAAGQVTEISASDARLPVVAWYGYVAGTPEGAQFDDYLVLMPEGVGEIGVEGADEAVEAQIVALRDRGEPGKYANFWGTLTCDVLDYGGCQLLVTRLRIDGPGPFFPSDPVEGWEGTIISGPLGPRSGGDDYFLLAAGFPVQYGIDSLDPALRSQLESLRDTGTVIRVWGQLSAGVMDWNATQIQVTRLEVAED